MELKLFISMVPNFEDMTNKDKILLLGWHFHNNAQKRIFCTGDIRKCFELLHLNPPNISDYLIRMATANPPSMIRSKGGYSLHRRSIVELDARYGTHPVTTAVSKLLSDLPQLVPDLTERSFLNETISCYRAQAYRAAIIMAWILAYDHLIRWIFSDSTRVAALNAAFSRKFLKNPPNALQIDDLTSVKEFDVIEACGSARLVSSNLTKILKEKLTKRNIAAHPSSVIITESQANDVITDLINNVIITLN